MSRPDPVAGERIRDAMRTAERFFMGTSEVHQALERLVAALDSIGVAYAIVGAVALNEFGYRRVTDDVDVLLTREGLAAFKEAFLGRGYIERFPGSTGVRDTAAGVDIDVVLAGNFPGDGKPKPVAFPDPAASAERRGPISLLPLERFLELKLASGMTAPHRLRDLADVLEVIRIQQLPESLADRLDPYVRAKYLELWRAAQGTDPA